MSVAQNADFSCQSGKSGRESITLNNYVHKARLVDTSPMQYYPLWTVGTQRAVPPSFCLFGAASVWPVTVRRYFWRVSTTLLRHCSLPNLCHSQREWANVRITRLSGDSLLLISAATPSNMERPTMHKHLRLPWLRFGPHLQLSNVLLLLFYQHL